MMRTGSFQLPSFRLGTRSFSSQASEKVDTNKIFEVRTYNIKPEFYVPFLNLTNEHISKRTKYSKLNGYFTSEVADNINQVFHIWEYDHGDHRAQIRKDLVKDQDWMTQYMAKMRPMLDSQANIVYKQFDWAPIETPEGTNLYEWRAYRLQPGSTEKFAKIYREGFDARKAHSKPWGVFYSEVGELSMIGSFWPYQNWSHRDQVRKAIASDNVWKKAVEEMLPLIQQMDSKIVIPAAFSPLK
eukprot:TRINITY_DN8920_c0_g1_i1.p1 TRINITY_DN8920_c0_g1~~TRINITY_DN8920_c0_g1_i1.p1  ORF type:complete len:242 (+),score=58.66 TRINITY_DN8920_c0_g1_i1:116-841(+)